MVTVCPTITAYEPHEYREQMERVAGFATRVHIDLMDGELAPHKSVSLNSVWWPHNVSADIHLMYQHPGAVLIDIIKLKPNMVIIHAEAEADHMHFAAKLHEAGINCGLAVLQKTEVESIAQILHSFDQLLIFSGNLGEHGGFADLSLLNKIAQVKPHHEDIEIAWDGGINDVNAAKLVNAGVEVLNVGGYVQKAADPKSAYDTIKMLAKDTYDKDIH